MEKSTKENLWSVLSRENSIQVSVLPNVVWINPERRDFVNIRSFCGNDCRLEESWNVNRDTGSDDDEEQLGDTFVDILDVLLSVLIWVADCRTSKISK